MKVTTKYASFEDAAPAAALPRGIALHAVESAHAADSAPATVHPRDWHAPVADNDAHPDGLLSRAAFLRMVQREKRRTDRSHSALSLAVLDIDADCQDTLDVVVERVTTMARETDYVAAMDDARIAVLLPDTGEAGLRSFFDKVVLARQLQSTVVAGATYPGVDFDRLVTERLGTPRSRHAVDGGAPVSIPAHAYPLKRALDVVGALFALVLLSPLMLLVALAVKLSSPGPVIFRQTRVGQGGAPFTFYKFRSMRTDMDDRVHREFVAALIDGKQASSNAAGASGEFKMKADPRITPIGRFIRKTSIDELPQFFNVLKGDMSLVGPRPPVTYEAEKYKTWHRRRVLDLKPGLTGIWQIEGRSRVSFDEMVRMDLRYLRHCSLRFDLSVLLRTVLVVLTCEGAR
jgi:lipopolysaccharide/colanic/teichoic acid biosynthesis glycosyltransferase